MSVRIRRLWYADDPLMLRCHDGERGAPVHDDRALFGILVGCFRYPEIARSG